MVFVLECKHCNVVLNTNTHHHAKLLFFVLWAKKALHKLCGEDKMIVCKHLGYTGLHTLLYNK